MTGPVLGVLLVTVWTNDGVPVARLRGSEGVDGRPRELGVFAGSEAIRDGVIRWLDDLERHGDVTE
ncbi:hypothetical protein [Actinoplanes sp. NPDC023714]|uniref:hypothetical protein n=1 Tax=Actinoplanes sp. NPDC023714 TaxID=3154322 RepID=UPI0033F99F40